MSDPTISAAGISLDQGGTMKKKRVLRVFGSVPSAAQKDRILKLVQRRAGNEYLIMDNLFVELLWDG